MLGFILRNSGAFSNLNTYITLYNVYVRCHLEYAAIIWSPYYKVYIDLIEKVQKKFLRYLYFKKYGIYPSYEPSLTLRKEFGFMELEKRRTLLLSLFIHKLILNLIDSPTFLQKLSFYVPQYTHRRVPLFLPNIAKTNYILNSPLHRISTTMNILSDIDIFSTSCTKLKMKIIDILQ